MRRRTFLQGATALIGLGWGVARAGVPDRVIQLSEAYRNAARLGRPLLVFVIPETGTDQGWSALWQRQTAFGQLLTYADAPTRERLAGASLVAASMADLGVLVPQTAPADAPLFVVIDTTVVPAAVRPLSGAFVSHVAGPWDTPVDDEHGWEERWKLEAAASDAVIDANLAMLSGLLAGALPRSAATWDGKPPAGSSYWTTGGCGAQPEDPAERDDSVGGMMCGMGNVTERERRFLHFFAGAQ